MEKPNIYQRINACMKAVKYVQKDATITNYRAVTHDQVVSVVRQAFVDNGIVVYPYLDCDRETRVTAILKPNGEATNIIRYEATFYVFFVNMDDPEDRISVQVEVHANDSGDKAPGKAVTYATKMAILKILCLETGENDESRTQVDDITAEIEAIGGAKTMEELRVAFTRSFNAHRGKKPLLLELSKAKDEARRRLEANEAPK